MKRALPAACTLLSLISVSSFARGVSPYLPLNLDPQIERQVEHVLLLADKPILTRPIAAATVLDALPAACAKDPVLCQQVRTYLARYMRNWSLTEASVEVSTSSHAIDSLPNSYGQTTDSAWNASVRGFWQPTDLLLFSAGAVAYDGEIVPEGSMVSLGWDRAQLDIGYRAHWLSPAEGSSMLIGTHAATLPSITLSNYQPLTRFGIQYEAFLAAMEKSDRVKFNGGEESGRPRLFGLHLGMEPASGWALSVNRLMQFGGGPRPGGINDLLRAFFNPSHFDNTGQPGSVGEFGNQVASVTSAFIFPGRVPFKVYVEHAGEDTSDLKPFLLGNAALTFGIYFPRLWQSFNLTYEVSEWQNGWYINGNYGDGLTNKGHVIGHWGADDRRPDNAPGAQSHMLRVGWDPKFGGEFELRLATLANESYFGPYDRAYNGTLSYSRPFGSFRAGVDVMAGRDVFGENVNRVGAFFRYTGDSGLTGPRYDTGVEDVVDQSAALFVEAGASAGRVKIEPDEGVSFRHNSSGAHVAIGARRAVSDRSDLGARLELDDVDGHVLTSVRMIDYRYRFANPLAATFFVGASRYDLATPAYGLYFGAGVQWRNIMPGWDIGLDVREAMKVARDHLLPSDPPASPRPDSFYTIESVSLSLTKRF